MSIFSTPPQPELHLDVFVCEVLGAAFLMSFGCLGMYSHPECFQPVSILKASLIFAFLISAISIAIGYVSGCQLSPCVTLCSIILGRISPLNALLCSIAEIMGCFIGMAMAIFLVPQKLYQEYNTKLYCGFCTTSVHPNLNVIQGLAMEFLALFVLILCVCSASDPRNKVLKRSNPVNFIGAIGVLVIGTGPFTGCSLNPFRSLAPAVFSNCWKHHWVYWVGPLSGSAAATLLYKYVLQKKEPLSPPSLLSSNHHSNMRGEPRMRNLSTNTRINRSEPSEPRNRTRTKRNGPDSS